MTETQQIQKNSKKLASKTMKVKNKEKRKDLKDDRGK